MGHKQNITGTRSVLSSLEEVRAAVVQVAGAATRTLSIFTQDLEPALYDQDDFLEALKRLVLGKPFARVRVLIGDPARAVRDGNRFVTMGRRLNTYIEIRNIRHDLRRQHSSAFLIADDHALVYRLQASRWDGMAELNGPLIARKYLGFFDELWHASELEPALKQLYVS